MAPEKGKEKNVKEPKTPKVTRSGRVSTKPKKLAESSSDVTAPKPKRKSTKSSTAQEPVPPAGKYFFSLLVKYLTAGGTGSCTVVLFVDFLLGLGAVTSEELPASFLGFVLTRPLLVSFGAFGSFTFFSFPLSGAILVELPNYKLELLFLSLKTRTLFF